MSLLNSKINLDQIKREARRLSQSTGKSHMQCLEQLSKERGFNTYAALRAAAIRNEP